MNRVDFIDSDKFKEKLKNPNVEIGQRWESNNHHDFGHGPIAYVAKVIMHEPFGDRWIVQYQLPTGGMIQNGMNNLDRLTEEQIKENFQFITTPIQAVNLSFSNNMSGTFFMPPPAWS